MSRPARFLTRLRALWSRTPTVAVALALITLCGWTLHEVIPRYGVERHRHQGPGRLDHPTFLIGDCAYYRATLVSLLEDGDLDVQNNLCGAALSAGVQRLARAAWRVLSQAPDPAGRRRAAVLRRRGRHRPAGVQPGAALRPGAGDVGRRAALRLRHGRVRAHVVVRVRDAVAAGRLQLRARRAVEPAGRGGIVALLYARCVVAGLLLGLSVWAKWTNAIFFPVAAVALAARRDWRSLWRFGAAAALPIAGLLGLNAHMFGSPFVTPYDRVLIVENNRWVARTVAPDVLHGSVLARAVDAADAPDAGAGGGRAAVPAGAARLRAAGTAAPAGRRSWLAARASPSSRCSRNTSSGTCRATGRASCSPSWP